MTLADRVVAVLTGHGIPHALIGAAALAAAGIARSTFDLDLLTTDARVLQADLWQDLRDAGAAVDVRRGDHSDPLLGVVRLEMPDQRPVDLIVGRHQWQRIAIERARREPGGIAVVIPRDLVLLKLYAGGSQDLWDVRELLRLPRAAALAAEVEADLDRLPRAARDAWVRVRDHLTDD
jgi:hypothetical protein